MGETAENRQERQHAESPSCLGNAEESGDGPAKCKNDDRVHHSAHSLQRLCTVLKRGVAPIDRLHEQLVRRKIAHHVQQGESEKKNGRDAEIGRTEDASHNDIAQERTGLRESLVEAKRQAAVENLTVNGH